MNRKSTLSKIFFVLPFAIYGVLGLFFVLASHFPYAFEVGITENIGFAILFFGWVPSLASTVAGVVFSRLSLKERHGKAFLICSCVNVAVSVAWGFWGIQSMMPYEPKFY